MASRAIFIGLGGSGGRTLDHIYSELEMRLLESGWTEGMPSGWQFLVVDVPHEAETDRSSGVSPTRLRDRDAYFPLTRYGEKYPNYVHDLEKKPEVSAGWMPSTDSVLGDIYEGAGQMRAVGRVLVLDNIAMLKDRLEKVIIPLVDGSEVQAQMGNLNLRLGDTDRLDIVDVWVITSYAGGSGSGMNLDVSLLLRSIDHPGLQSHLAIAYAADIFDGLDQADVAQAVPNSLAALSEFMSVSYGPQSISPTEQAVLQMAKSPSPKLSGSRVPQKTFFQGKSNGVLSLSDSNEVYRATARGIVALHLDPTIRTDFRKHLISNTPSASSPDELRSLRWQGATGKETQPASSFGFATVTLGRSLFAKYGAERLTRMVLEKVLELDDETAKRKSLDPQSFEAPSTLFAKGCNLLEKGEEQISTEMEQLCALDIDGHIEGFAKHAFDQVRSDSQPPEKIAGALVKFFNDKVESSGFLAGIDLGLEKGARQWIDLATKRLMEATIRSIAKDGVAATAIYLDALREQLEDEAQEIGSTVTKAPSTSQRSARQPNRPPAKPKGLAALFGRHAEAVVATIPNGPQQVLERLVADEHTVWEKRWNAKRIDLLRGFAAMVVAPLRNEVLDVAEGLRSLHRKDTTFSTAFSKLTKGEVTSAHEPAPNELVLGAVTGEDGFQQKFEEIIEQCFPGETSGEKVKYESVKDLAVAEVLGGSSSKARYWPSDQSNPELVSLECTRPWNRDGALPAMFSFSVDFGEVLSSARLWMSTRSVMQAYVNESLGDYLNFEGSEGVTRRQEFTTKLGVAMEFATPMVRLNRNAYQSFHDGDVGYSSEVSSIPLSSAFENDRRQVLNILEKAGVNTSKAFDTNGSSKSVNVTRFLGTFVHPVVMDSVMGPILDQWSVADSNFWKFRRARPLPQFIPLSDDVQREMVVGWYVLRALDVITSDLIDSFVRDGESAALAVPTAAGPRRLPGRLLTPIREGEQKDAISLIMESYVLALVALTSGDEENLEAYKGLTRIGRSAGRILRSVIQDGSAELCEDFTISFMPDAAADARKSFMLEYVASRVNEIDQTKIPSWASPSDTTLFTPRWEMREVLKAALLEIQSAVSVDAGPTNETSLHD